MQHPDVLEHIKLWACDPYLDRPRQIRYGLFIASEFPYLNLI